MMMNRIERLREVGRILFLYLYAAEYLSGDEAQPQISEALADCVNISQLSEDADLEETRRALARAFKVLNNVYEQSLFEELQLGADADAAPVDLEPLMQDGIQQIAALLDLLDLGEPSEVGDDIRFARCSVELASCLLFVGLTPLPHMRIEPEVESRAVNLLLLAARLTNEPGDFSSEKEKLEVLREADSFIKTLESGLHLNARFNSNPGQQKLRIVEQTNSQRSEVLSLVFPV